MTIRVRWRSCSRGTAGLLRVSSGKRSSTIQRSSIGSTSEILLCIWLRPDIASRLLDYCWRPAPTQTPRKITGEAARCITQRTVSSLVLPGMRKGRWRLSGACWTKVPTSICRTRTELPLCTARSGRGVRPRCDVFWELAVTRQRGTNPGLLRSTWPCRTPGVVGRARRWR